MSVAFSIAYGCNTDHHPSVLFIMYFRSVFIIKNDALVSKNKSRYFGIYAVFTFKKKKNLASVSNQVRPDPA